MAAESNVGARIFLIGKDAALGGLKEIQGAVARLNATIAAGADAAKTAAAGNDVEEASIVRMNAAMDVYKANLAETTLATDSLARVGKYAFFAIASAAAAWGYESVKWAQSYQTALVQLRTQAGLTARAVRQIGSAAMANASSLGISPTTYLQTIYHPASAGFNVKTSEAITTNAAKLAAIGGSPVETTANAITGVMRAYNYKAAQAGHVTALTNAIIGAGNMHAATLNAALASGVAASAKTFGVSYRSLGSALAFMTDRGVPAAQAGTHLRMTLSLLGAPSQLAGTLLRIAGMTTKKILSSTNGLSQMLQAAGVRSSQLARALRTNKGGGGIYNALEVLHQGLTKAGLTPQMAGAMISRTFGGGRMGTTIEMMYNSLGTLHKKATKIQRTGTTSRFNKDWAKETATLDFQLHRMEATIETLGTAFGTKLIPPLTKAVSLFTDMLKWLGKNKDVAYALAGIVTAVLAPAIGLYLYRALFKSGGAIKTVLQGYRNLIWGNNSEQQALKQTARQLTLTTAETETLARKNAMLGGAANTTAGKIATETGAEDINTGAADADAAATERLAAAERAAGERALTATGAAAAPAGAAAAATARAAAGATTNLGLATAAGAIFLRPYVQPYAKKWTGTSTVFSGLKDVRNIFDDITGRHPKEQEHRVTDDVPVVRMTGKHDRTVHVHVYIDGKEIVQSTAKRTRRHVALAAP